MLNNKLILRKESFGGLFIDTKVGRRLFLQPHEYESKKQELVKIQKQGKNVNFFDATLKGYSLLNNAVSSPTDIFFELTKRCNTLCTQCFMDAKTPRWNNTQEVSFMEIEDIVKQFSNMGGFSIRLTGGEPTIRKDFFDIVDLINEEGLIVGLNTNGLFGEKKLEKILSKGIKDMRISLDGPEDVNDGIRSKGTYRKIIRTLDNIAQYNKTSDEPAQVVINVVLMKSTKDSVEEMIALAQHYGSKISFGLLRISGRAKREDMLCPEEVIQAAYKVEGMRKRFGLTKETVRINYDIFCEEGTAKKGGKFPPFPFDNSKCPLGISGFSVDAYARIVPCGYFVNIDNGKLVGEDVRGKDLLNIWHNSPILNKVRQVTRKGCRDCDYHIVKCNGGCPVMAYVFEGNIDGKDPYCVRHLDIPAIIESLSR